MTAGPAAIAPTGMAPGGSAAVAAAAIFACDEAARCGWFDDYLPSSALICWIALPQPMLTSILCAWRQWMM